MKISSILYNSLANGDGERMVIFFSGCHHACEGCHNKDIWDINSGRDMTIYEVLTEIYKNKDTIDGITLSGGEPLDQIGDASIIAKAAKEMGLTVWLYTGYKLPMNFRNVENLFDNVDVVIDGRFEIRFKDENLKYKGSSNQNTWRKKIIDGKERWIIDNE